jgi:hypothetical protein
MGPEWVPKWSNLTPKMVILGSSIDRSMVLHHVLMLQITDLDMIHRDFTLQIIDFGLFLVF